MAADPQLQRPGGRAWRRSSPRPRSLTSFGRRSPRATSFRPRASSPTAAFTAAMSRARMARAMRLTCSTWTAFLPADWRTGATARAGNPGAVDIGRALTPAELDALRAQAKSASTRRTEEAVKRQAAAREVAARIWHAARPAGDEHRYLARKGVAAHGLARVQGGVARADPRRGRRAAQPAIHRRQRHEAIPEGRAGRRPVLSDGCSGQRGLHRRGLRHGRQYSRSNRVRRRRCLQRR
jgi:hypothetical protein